ncbi:AI-2E family transporter [Occultella kanbiaonis]|uniref:AI-2E family transporter n=1 Tax=Occultella kanbiaonis TaxID=2675754 RepID=UPI0013D703D5|nr:AI-2E family transporter [Occultella kanbiaonis]
MSTQSGTGVLEVNSRPSLHTTALVLGGLTIAAVGLHFASSIIAPTFFALTLIVSARPLQMWLTRHRVHPMVAAILVLLFLYVILVALVIMLALSIARLVTELPAYSYRFQAIYTDLIEWLSQFGVDEQTLEGVLGDFDLNRIVGLLGTVLEGMSSAGGQAALLLVVMFFLAIDSTNVGRRFELSVAQRPNLTAALADFVTGVRKYWIVATVFGLIVAVLDVIALSIIGVPMVLVWGVLAFVTNYIPNVGFVLGLIPPALIALVDGGVSQMIWVIVVYSVLNFTVQTIIQPKVTGDAVGLSPVVSFLSLTFWTLVVGPLGAILAVPLTLFAKAVLVDAHPASRWISAYLITDAEARKQLARFRDAKTGADPEPEAADPDPVDAEAGPEPAGTEATVSAVGGSVADGPDESGADGDDDPGAERRPQA